MFAFEAVLNRAKLVDLSKVFLFVHVIQLEFLCEMSSLLRETKCF